MVEPVYGGMWRIKNCNTNKLKEKAGKLPAFLCLKSEFLNLRNLITIVVFSR